MPRPTPRLVACLLVATAAFLLGADAASIACMAVATCLVTAAAWGLASVLAARWLPGVHDAENTGFAGDSGRDAGVAGQPVAEARQWAERLRVAGRPASGARRWTSDAHGRFGRLVATDTASAVREGLAATGTTSMARKRLTTRLPLLIARLAIAALHAFLPRPVPVRASWERIDQHDRVVEEIPGEPDPARRGLYRLASETFEYRDIFGLWAVREKRGGGRELVIPPAADKAQRMIAIDQAVARALPATGSSLDTAMVRPYAPGDSLRGISWRQTAHHGELISFETVASERGRVVLVADATGLREGADELAATALAAFQLLSRTGAHVTVTDGVSHHADPASIQRFCAALWPEEPRGDNGGGNRNGDDGAMHTRARAIAQLAGQANKGAVRSRRLAGDTRARVIVISSSAGTPLARALATTVPDAQLEHVIVPPRVAVEGTRASGGEQRDGNRGEQPSPHGKATRGDADASQDATRNERLHCFSRVRHRLAALASPLLSGIACATALALAVQLLPGLLDAGAWLTFARIALPLAGIAAPLLDLVPRRWVRATLAIVGAIALIAAGVFSSAALIQQATGAWPLGSLEEQARAAGGLGVTFSQDGQEGALLIVVLAQGLAKLYFGQWVPLTVSTMSDAALVITFGAVAALQLVVLRARRLRPLVALLPITVLTLRYAALGLPSSTGEIIASTACGLVLLALIGSGGTARAASGAARATASQTPASGGRALAAGTPAPAAGTPAPRIQFRTFSGRFLSGIVSSAQVGARRPSARAAATASRSSARVLPRVAIALVLAVLGVALSPDAVTRSQDFPVKLGLARYLSDEYAVSPLVSLKQDLTRNGTTVALTYETTSNGPLYLRMSTLDSFDGSVWLTDSTIPAQATTGLVDTLLGNAASATDSSTNNAMTTGANAASTSLPLAEALAAASALRSQQVAENDGSQAGQGGGGSVNASANTAGSASAASSSTLLNALRPQAGTAIGPAQTVYASVRIAGLTTRFAPLPTGTISAVDENAIAAVQDASSEDGSQNTGDGTDSASIADPSSNSSSPDSLASAVSGDWQWSRDDLLYGTASSTRRDMRYLATSYYLPAISSLADMNAIANLPQDLYDGCVTATDELNGLLSTHYETGQEPSEAFYTMRDPADDYRDGRGTERYRAVPQDIPQEIRDVADAARAEGIDATGKYTTVQGYRKQYEVMRYLVGYFTDAQAGWTYSLDAPDGGGSDNLQVIAEFLKTKRGYCVHYASSLALLARMLGVPSRMVTGYRANAAGKQADGSYAVTNHDLHAWVEVYLSGVGWVPFDVTPGGGSDDTASAEQGAQAETQAQAEQQNLRGANAGQDAAQADAEAGQSQGSGADGDSGASPFAAVTALARAVARFARGNAPWVIVGLAVAAVVIGPRAWRTARRRWRLRVVEGGASVGASSEEKRRAIEAAWEEMCITAEVLGVYAKTSATEHSFAEAVVRAIPGDETREAVETLRDLVCAERYEPPGASDADLSSLPELLGRLLAAIDGAPRSHRKGVAGFLHALRRRLSRR